MFGMSLAFWLAALYFMVALLTARVVCIWLGEDDRSNPIATAFACAFIAVFWPIVWIVRYINKGFANPLRPW